MTLRYTFQTKPYSHQLRALAKIAKLDGVCGLWMPMRTGKTKTVIDWAGIAYHNYGLRRVLVITPATVMSVWRDEIALHCPVPSTVTLLDGSLARRAQQINDARNMPTEGIDWLVVNYEAVWRNYGKGKKLDDLLRNWGPDLVVADESHKLKNPTTRQSKSVAKIARVAGMRLALTGTPVTKSPLDLFGQLRFLDPEILTKEDGSSQTWSYFKQRYGVWGGYLGYELKGYRHLDELTGLVKAHSFKVLLEECFDLPKKEFVTVPVSLSPEARAIYRTMAKEMIVELESGTVSTADIVLVKLLRLSQITSGFLKDVEGDIIEVDHAKLDACIDLVERMVEADEKVVIFARFKHDLAAIREKCDRGGISSVTLDGSVPQGKREGLIKAFRNDPKVMVFIAQTAAGSLGIDLTAARFAIFYSLDYRWDTYVQAIERIGGPKQMRPMTVYHLIVPHSIDQIMLDVLKVRGNLARAVIHDPAMLLDFD